MIFIALIPLLWVEHQITSKKTKGRGRSVFGYSYLAFFTFNMISTWWIYHASLPGMVMAVVFNSLFMAILFWLFHYTKRWLGLKVGYIALIIYWIGFEWVHYNWELSWVWLSLGNVFAIKPRWVQWYEYTGVMGGSLWVLITNILAFISIKKYMETDKLKSVIKEWVSLACFIVFPLLISYLMFSNYKTTEDPVNVVIVQPNIDPYYDKFEGMTDMEQIEQFISLAEEKTTKETDFVVGPETALPGGYFESEIHEEPVVKRLEEFINSNKNIRLVIGLSSYKAYDTPEKPTPTARPFRRGGGYYDAYNSAMQMDTSGMYQIYHKSKLVLGVERLPFSFLLSPLEDLAIDLGGTTGSLGIQEQPSVFGIRHEKLLSEKDNGTIVAPVICYESVYGEYCTEYIKRGAELIFIITNDGWWDNTPGYKQHLAYARLRAIETRRSIVRSANTGISCFINQKGELFNTTKWWEPAAISGQVNKNNKMTFYSRHGDFIGRIAGFFAVLLLFWTLVKKLNKTEQRLKS